MTKLQSVGAPHQVRMRSMKVSDRSLPGPVAHRRHLHLQYLPAAVLHRILQYLDHRELRSLYMGPSSTLVRWANAVMMERLITGWSIHRGRGAVDQDQVLKSMTLCRSIHEARRTHISDRHESSSSSDTSASNTHRGRLVGRPDSGSESFSKTSTQSCYPTGTSSFRAGMEKLPDELLLPILREQTFTVLKDISKCGLVRIARTAETILFEWRRTIFKIWNVRGKASGDSDAQRMRCPPVSEKGEQYAGRKFVLVNRDIADGPMVDFDTVNTVYKPFALGSFWKVVCVTEDDSSL